ncbi:MAG: Transcriptional regulatory protein ZraR [bacterium]|nr:Transcriptional regulatory protein ZraR [bacterium]
MPEIPYPLRGESAAIRRAREHLARAAGTDYPILLTGESGVGKQAAAEWTHGLSARAKHPFVEVNSSCWNGNTMVHSVLFGHERGAFTGANIRREGCFERADGGTLFLDEIGELSMEVQPMLLKAIDQGLIEPVGAARPKRVEVRLVCATNRNLDEEVRAGRFRLDLHARIGALEIRIPSLSERLEDLEILWKSLCARRGIEVPITPEIRERTSSGELRDNLRGLERLAIRMAVWGDQGVADGISGVSG